VVALLAFTIICLGMLACLLFWAASIQFGLIPPNTTPGFAMTWQVAWPLATNAITLLVTILIVVDTRLRFDRIAGRMTAGVVETAADAWLYCQPRQPAP